MFMRFVDLKKAFDRVRLKDVITLLKQEAVNNKYIDISRELNNQNKIRVKKI